MEPKSDQNELQSDAKRQQGSPLFLLTSSTRFGQKTMPAVLKSHARGQQKKRDSVLTFGIKRQHEKHRFQTPRFLNIPYGFWKWSRSPPSTGSRWAYLQSTCSFFKSSLFFSTKSKLGASWHWNRPLQLFSLPQLHHLFLVESTFPTRHVRNPQSSPAEAVSRGKFLTRITI